jgi:hypothetical protein
MPDVIVMNRKEMGNSHSLGGGVAYIIIARYKKSEYHNLWESIKRVFPREREGEKGHYFMDSTNSRRILFRSAPKSRSSLTASSSRSTAARSSLGLV